MDVTGTTPMRLLAATTFLLIIGAAGCSGTTNGGGAGSGGQSTENDDDSSDDDGTTTTEVDTTTTGEEGDGDATSGSGWKAISAPARPVHINSVHFHDDKRGWLTTTSPNPMVDERGAWYTDNGGETWNLRREQFDALVARFDANGERAWMGGSDRRELWYSDDNKDFKPKHQAIDPHDTVSELYFWNKKVGIIGSETAGRIHRTADGGESWRLHEFEKKDAGFNDFEVLGDHVWASTGVDFQGDGTGARIHYSTDRGQTWELHKLEDQAHHYKGGSIQSVHAVSKKEVWAAGVNRQLYHTTDGMESWEQIEGVPADAYGFNDIDGIGDHLIAGGNHDKGAFIYESTDGGETWETTFVGECGTDCEIEGIEFVHKELAYAYGYGGTLIRFNGR